MDSQKRKRTCSFFLPDQCPLGREGVPRNLFRGVVQRRRNPETPVTSLPDVGWTSGVRFLLRVGRVQIPRRPNSSLRPDTTLVRVEDLPGHTVLTHPVGSDDRRVYTPTPKVNRGETQEPPFSLPLEIEVKGLHLYLRIVLSRSSSRTFSVPT